MPCAQCAHCEVVNQRTATPANHLVVAPNAATKSPYPAAQTPTRLRAPLHRSHDDQSRRVNVLNGQDGVHACIVRNVTNQGAGLRLNGLNIVPSAFDISFDNFRTMRRCQLIWRDSDFVGAAFES
jgi:hypothetical protein